MREIHVIDSHTGGEPTRIIVAGGPDLGAGTLAERRQRFARDFDRIRSAVILEPRGSDVLVGGLLCEPVDTTCAAGVIFFNNTGYLNMCGHGTIGLVVTLAHLQRISVGEHRIETPVGTVTADLLDSHRVAVRNVPSWRYRSAVTVEVPGHGPVTGDIAWGGNWFFLVSDHGQPLEFSDCGRLTEFAGRIKAALQREGIRGSDQGLIDHIELCAAPPDPDVADSQNFVLCPGGAYDRSPCGTGTSARLACLAADGKLTSGQLWRQQSIIGTVFEGRFEILDNRADFPEAEGPVVVPTIVGSAWVTAAAKLILDPSDPFEAGIRP
ncbi:MAG: proline racemase family protein [Fuerstiella sp.]